MPLCGAEIWLEIRRVEVLLDIDGDCIQHIGQILELNVSKTETWRRLAPAGGFSPPNSILMAARSVWQTGTGSSGRSVQRVLEDQVRSSFDGAHVLLTESGTVALSIIFSALRQHGVSRVSCGAYTCPDIVTAAISAGVTLDLLDIDERTLEPERSDGVVLLSNLYGLPDRRPGDASIIIDDGCQAALSLTPDGYVGSRRGCIGVLSFGRGKSLSGIGGGAVIIGSGISADLVQLVQERANTEIFSRTSLLREGGQWLKAILSWALAYPALYTIPASLPFLRLGETTFHRKLSHPPWANAMGYTALAVLSRSNELRRIQVQNARRWHEALKPLDLVEPFVERGYDFDGSTVPIRYPVLLPTGERRDRLLPKLGRYGASRSYPAVLPDLCPEMFGDLELSGARFVSQRILTLPVHEHVSEGDVEQVVAIMRTELEQIS